MSLRQDDNTDEIRPKRSCYNNPVTQTIQNPKSKTQNPLRVLYLIGSYGPDVMGNASHEQMVLALRARGHDVEVFTQMTEPGKPLYTKAAYSGVTVYRVNLAASGNRLAGLVRPMASKLLQYEYLPQMVAAFRRHLRTRKYDLLHVEGAYPFGLIAALSAGRTPFLVNVQGADVIRLPEADYGYRRFGLPRAAVSLVFKRASLVRSISPLLADYIVEEGLVGRERVEVVPRSIEDAAFPPQNEPLDDFRVRSRREIGDRYGVGLNRPIVIALSRLHPFKGLEYLVDAIPKLIAARIAEHKQPPWILICGPSRSTPHFGDYREFLLQRASDAGVASHIVFTGQVEHDQVRCHLAASHILVCPSIIEAQNKVVPEACAVGTPSIVTSTTGITSYLAPLDACISVPPRDSDAIAKGVLAMLDSTEAYHHVQRQALRAAETLRTEMLAPKLEGVWYRAARRS